VTAVVITGVGLHGALGDGAQTLAALAAGRSALAMHALDRTTGLPPLPAAPAPVDDQLLVPLLPDRKLVKYMSPTARLAVLAAGRALASADLLGPAQAERRAASGLFVATGLIAFDLASVGGGIDAARSTAGQLDLLRLGRDGLRRCHPLLPFKMLLNMPLGLISIAYGVRGDNFILYPDAAQAGVAFEAAVRGLRAGRIERALVGASAQPVSLMPLCTLRRRERLAPDVGAARPHGPAHAGVAPADAGAFLVLETARAARERGARPLATLAGAAAGRAGAADRPARIDRRRALWAQAAGGARPDLLLSTGNVDRREDEDEARAVTGVWPGPAPRLASLDGLVGWQGAAGLPFAAALAALALARGVALPTGDGPAGPPPRHVLVAASDPDGAAAAVMLGPAPEEAAA
jgi:3-oxoacyl-[acyl-carrier-protein] synthase II